MTTIASARLPDGVQMPHYDRQQLKTRMVHFGFGAFHRAHQALLTDRVPERPAGIGEFVKSACSTVTR